MEFWQRFASHKERGEWVELQFMAQAARRRFAVSKPWGDMGAYDVGIECGDNFLRVQVKCTTQRLGAGYRCQMRPKHRKRQPYTTNHIDLFAAYVIPANAWYLIPSTIILESGRARDIVICPITSPKKKASYRFERYREAWELLTKTRSDLAGLKQLGI
jgi:hypothetical protein